MNTCDLNYIISGFHCQPGPMPGDCGAARGFIEYDAGSLFFSAFFDNMEGYGRVNAVRKKLLIVLAAILVIALIGFIVY